MGYIVIEIQTTTDGAVGNIVWHFADRMQAESKYHSVLAAAAISALPLHAATMLADDGSYVMHQSYEHGE